MEEITTARERVFKNIRNANLKVDKNDVKDIDHETHIYPPVSDDLVIEFASQFNANGGQFVYCLNEKELASNLLAFIEERNIDFVSVQDNSLQQFCDHYQLQVTTERSNFVRDSVALVLAEHLIARTGSIQFSSKQTKGRSIYSSADYLLIIAYSDQIVKDIQTSIKKLKKDPTSSIISYISGPSKTHELNDSFTNGVYGTKEVILFLLESN